MITVTPQLKAHFGGNYLTLATLWRVTRTDGTLFYFTDHDQDIVYQGAVYLAASGYVPSAVQTSAGLQVDNLEVTSVLDSAFITDADLVAGLWDYAEVVIMVVNWADLTMADMVIRRGRMGEVSAGKMSFVAELRGMAQNLQQEIGRLIMPLCNADLGDSRCQVVLASYTSSSTVTEVISNENFTAAGLAGATWLFNNGKLTWTGGLNDGLSMEVKEFVAGGWIVLQQAMPYAIGIGDTFTVHQGCDKSTGIGGCTRFDNIINFQGYPHLPGVDRMVSGT